jgi:hypothetical protein
LQGTNALAYFSGAKMMGKKIYPIGQRFIFLFGWGPKLFQLFPQTSEEKKPKNFNFCGSGL